MADSAEHRLSQLEQEVATRKSRLPSQPNWIAENMGVCTYDRDFDEVVCLEKELRDAEASDQD